LAEFFATALAEDDAAQTAAQSTVGSTVTTQPAAPSTLPVVAFQDIDSTVEEENSTI
jgi:hypothetical protein